MGNSLRIAIEKEDWKRVRAMLQTFTVRTRVREKSYVIPRRLSNGKDCLDSPKETVGCLHVLMKQRPPLDIVQEVLDIAPCQIRLASTPTGEVPLHWALRNAQRPQQKRVLQYLLRMGPETVHHSSEQGQFPIHVACETLQPFWVLKQLVDADPAARWKTDRQTGLKPWDVVKAQSGGLRRCFYRWRVRRLLRVDDDESTIVLPTSTSESAVGAQDCCPNEKNANVSKIQEPAAEKGLCILCWDETADHVLVPCGHICLCQDCVSLGVSTAGGSCPVCKRSVERHVKVYHAGIMVTDKVQSS